MIGTREAILFWFTSFGSRRRDWAYAQWRCEVATGLSVTALDLGVGSAVVCVGIDVFSFVVGVLVVVGFVVRDGGRSLHGGGRCCLGLAADALTPASVSKRIHRVSACIVGGFIGEQRLRLQRGLPPPRTYVL